MLSVTDLLNPVTPGRGVAGSRYALSPLAPDFPAAHGSVTSTIMDRHLVTARKMVVKDPPRLVKSRAKGVVNFPPFEDLNEVSLREVAKYHIFPYGSIQDHCKHIPYNSGKKDFFEKTGRESFEGEKRRPIIFDLCCAV